MTTDTTRLAVTNSAQELFEASSATRLPTVEEVRLHGGYSMQDTAPALCDWLDQHSPVQEAPGSAHAPEAALEAAPWLKGVLDALEAIAVRAVEKAAANAARRSTGQRLILVTLAQICDEQRGALQAQSERLMAAESTITQIRAAVATDLRTAACREVALRQELADEKAETALAQPTVKERECAAEVAAKNLRDAHATVESLRDNVAMMKAENTALQETTAAHQRGLNELTNRLSVVLEFEESLTAWCDHATSFLARSERVRLQFAQVSPGLHAALLQHGRPRAAEDPRPARRTGRGHKAKLAG